MTTWILSIGLFVGVAGGCTSDVIDGPINYVRAGGPPDPSHTLQEIRIDLDGTVTRRGAGDGSEQATLDPQTIEDLHHTILVADFPKHHGDYLCDCFDDVVYIVQVHVSGVEYRVQSYREAQPPARLLHVIEMLDSIVEAQLDWQ